MAKRASPANLGNVVAIAGGTLSQPRTAKQRHDHRVGAKWSIIASISPPGLNNVVAIAASTHYSVALKSDGTVTAWGFPMTLPANLSNVVAIAADAEQDLALKSDGTVCRMGSRRLCSDQRPRT